MFQFYYGWMRLDPLCLVDNEYRHPVLVMDNRYTSEAAAELEKVISRQFSSEAVYVDEDSNVFIRPALYYGYLNELDRFGQLVVRPEDEPYLYQTPGISCDELRNLVRSPIDLTTRKVHAWPFSLYVMMRQPNDRTLDSWEELYKE